MCKVVLPYNSLCGIKWDDLIWFLTGFHLFILPCVGHNLFATLSQTNDVIAHCRCIAFIPTNFRVYSSVMLAVSRPRFAEP